MPRRAHDFRGLTHLSRLKVLRAVQRRPGSRLTEIAEASGLHINTARDHLSVLQEEGLVASHTVETRKRGRPPLVFVPVRDAQQNPKAAQRAEGARQRGDLLRKVAPDVDHGGSLGTSAAHQLDVLYEHLDDAGLEPSVDVDDLSICLSPCRYRNVVLTERPLLCSVHTQLVRSMLEQVPGPLALRELRPFVTEETCLLLLGLAYDVDEAPEGRAHGARP